MLSNTSKYAIRASIYIALHGADNRKLGIKKISQELDIPSPFLSKILQVLVKHKLLSSTKGPNGGFGIGKNPYEISLFDIIGIIDGNDLFEKCLISMRNCNEEGIPCPMHESYSKIRSDLLNLFKKQTIGNLAENISDAGNKIII